MEIEHFKIFALATLCVPALFYVGYGRVLTDSPQSKFVAGAISLVFVLAISGYFGGKLSPLLALALLVPAYQYVAFRTICALFTHYVGRRPVTAAFNFSSGIAADRVFNVTYFIIAVLAPLFVVAYMLRPNS